MNQDILIVDDEQKVLDGFKRHLRKKFTIHTALGPLEGLEAVKNNDPFAVIISDLKMPDMDGISFLVQVRELCPDSVRMILTGYAQLQNAVKAVNDGHVFQFLTKPCPPEVMIKALNAGIKQYQLVRAERELLEQTLNGSIKILTEMLSMANPEAFARASRAKTYALEVAIDLPERSEPWKIETAAMLSQIGFATLPGQSLEKMYQGQTLSQDDRDLFAKHPQIGSDLLKHIPRLEEVAEIIRCQEMRMDQAQEPVPLGARILKVALDFDLYLALEGSDPAALDRLKNDQSAYDPDVLQSFERILQTKEKYEDQKVMIKDLTSNMIVRKDIWTADGLLLVAGGQQLGPVFIKRLHNFQQSGRKVPEPIHVLVPKNES